MKKNTTSIEMDETSSTTFAFLHCFTVPDTEEEVESLVGFLRVHEKEFWYHSTLI